VLCIQTDIPGIFRPCIEKCDPYSLIFNPNTGGCVYDSMAPPGVCQDTPPPPPTGPTEPTPTASITPTTSIITESVTPSGTPSPPTSPIVTTQGTTFSTPTCSEPFAQYPYPGDCRRYLVCLPTPDGGLFLEDFECNPSQIYDVNSNACVTVSQDVCEQVCGEDDC